MFIRLVKNKQGKTPTYRRQKLHFYLNDCRQSFPIHLSFGWSLAPSKTNQSEVLLHADDCIIVYIFTNRKVTDMHLMKVIKDWIIFIGKNIKFDMYFT